MTVVAAAVEMTGRSTKDGRAEALWLEGAPMTKILDVSLGMYNRSGLFHQTFSTLK